jgi:hypothetical protein
MATVDITSRFLNQNKVEAEGLVVTIPAILKAGGGRSNAQPTYIQGGDALTANVISEDTLIKGAYVSIDEAFPAGAELNVDIAGTQYFVAVDAAAGGAFYVSTETDNFLKNPQTVTVSITGVTGDVTTGKARVMFDVFHPNIKNGQFAEA